mmetsp:Transcript_107576/g.302876  ORF Transcript_107576/g.302876 Transcript_107576/m.302876 type:complete len:326 (-) Transcript_107576:1529-2506(-)
MPRDVLELQVHLPIPHLHLNLIEDSAHGLSKALPRKRHNNTSRCGRRDVGFGRSVEDHLFHAEVRPNAERLWRLPRASAHRLAGDDEEQLSSHAVIGLDARPSVCFQVLRRRPLQQDGAGREFFGLECLHDYVEDARTNRVERKGALQAPLDTIPLQYPRERWGVFAMAPQSEAKLVVAHAADRCIRLRHKRLRHAFFLAKRLLAEHLAARQDAEQRRVACALTARYLELGIGSFPLLRADRVEHQVAVGVGVQDGGAVVWFANGLRELRVVNDGHLPLQDEDQLRIGEGCDNGFALFYLLLLHQRTHRQLLRLGQFAKKRERPD